MQRLHRNQNRIFHTLDPDAGAGSHAGEHSLHLLQLHHGRVAAGGGAGAVDLGQGAVERILADGADSDRNGLTQLQGEDVGFVHADGNGHFRAGGKGRHRGSCLIAVVHAVNAAVGGSQHCAVPLDGQQLQKRFLQLRPLPEQRIVVGAVVRVLQGKQLGAVGYLLVFGNADRGDRTGKAGDTQGAVDIQFARTDGSALAVLHRDSVIVGRAVVGDQNGGGSAHHRFHRAGEFLFVGLHHGDLLTYGQGIGLDVHRHIAVQTHKGQRAIGVHHIRHIRALFAKHRLDTAGNACDNPGVGSVILRVADFFVQRFNIRLQVCHSADDRSHIHRCQDVALCNRLIVTDLYRRDLHAGGHGDRFQVLVGQAAAAGDHRADRAGGDGVGLDFALSGGKLIAHLLLQQAHRHRQSDGKHQYDGNHRKDDPAFFSFFVLTQRFKKRVILFLGLGSFLFGLFAEQRRPLILQPHMRSFLCRKTYDRGSLSSVYQRKLLYN